MQLETISVSEVLAPMPELQPMDSLSERRFDLGVFPVGFEERGVISAERLAALGTRIATALTLEYTTNQADNAERRPALEAALRQMTIEPIRSHPADARRFDQDLAPLVEQISADVPRVYVDSSAAANSLLLDLVWFFTERACELTIGYTAAEHYFPRKQDVFTEKGNYRRKPRVPETSEGTADLLIDIHHIGRFAESGQDVIILVPGFDHDRSRKLITSVDRSLLSHNYERVHWVLGNPLDPDDAWRRDYQRHQHEAAGCGQVPDSLHPCSTFDYREMVSLLDTICSTDALPANSRITLSPMGSKMQAVGCALFCIARPEIRVKFAIPAKYSVRHYSEGAGGSWVLELGGGPDLRKRMQSIGELRVRGEEGKLVFERTTRNWA